MIDVGLDEYRVLLAVAFFLAATHAYRKLSPYFAVTWFGAGLLFGVLWSSGGSDPERVLLPALVVYMAAAVTKGLVETSRNLAGNHVVHVLLTGAFSGLLAMPFVAAASASGWPLPREADRALLGVDPDWLGGVSLDALVLWSVMGLVFYGAYKVSDHVGLPPAVQTVVIFAAQPFLVQAVDGLHGLT